MAVNIGPRIGIDGEKEYRKQLQNIITETKTLGTEMKKLQSSYDSDSKTLKQNKAERQLLTQQIEKQKEAVSQMKDMLEKAKSATGENSSETQKWQQAVNNAEADLNKLNQTLKDMPNGLQIVGDKMKTVGDKITGVGKALMPLSAAASAGIGASVKLAADFEGQMAKVQAISGASSDDLVTLTAKAREMGATTKFSASEAGAAMEYMAMAGWKTEDMVDGVSGVMNLAAASGEDLATVSDIVTDALTAMGLSAGDSGHFADVLAAASSNANTNVSMMGETFKYAAPLAGALGFDIEDLAVATGLMANAGIKGSQSGTALRGWLTRLAKPTKESGTAMEALGLSLTDADGNMKSLMQVMEETRDAFQGLTEDEKAQYAAMLAGQNGMSGLLAVVNASEADFNKLSVAVSNANGTAENMANTMQNNLNGQLTILKSGLEEAAISIGNALLPAIKGIADKVQDAVTWFNSLDEGTKTTVAGIGVFVAAIGPVLVALGTVISSIGTIVSAVGGAVSAIGGLGAAFTAAGGMAGILSTAGGVLAGIIAAIASPVGIAVAAIAGLTAAGVLLYQNWDTVKAKAAELAGEVKAKWEEIKTNISTAVENAKRAVDEKFSAIKTKVTEIGTTITTTLGELPGKALKWGKDLIGNFVEGLKKKWDDLKDTVTGVAGGISNVLGFSEPKEGPLSDFHTYAPDMMELFASGIRQNMGVVRDAVADMATTIDMGVNGNGGTVINQGGATVTVYARDGQSAREIAEEVADIINSGVQSRGAVWA